jgi:hypothetical protein
VSVYQDGQTLTIATVKPTDLMKATDLNGITELATEIEREVFTMMHQAAWNENKRLPAARRNSGNDMTSPDRPKQVGRQSPYRESRCIASERHMKTHSSNHLTVLRLCDHEMTVFDDGVPGGICGFGRTKPLNRHWPESA